MILPHLSGRFGEKSREYVFRKFSLQEKLVAPLIATHVVD